MNFFKKNIANFLFVSCLIFFLSFTSVWAYNFEDSTGLGKTAETSGHKAQKLFGSEGSLELGVGTIIQAALSLIGIVFLVLIVYGGITWMTATGNEEKVKKAKKIITESIIGLFVVLLAYSITYFVISSLF